MDPKDLIIEAKGGNKGAFGKLYELYYSPVYRYIYFRIRKKEDVEDLVQVVFLKVYESIEKYQEKGTDPLAYFFTVARNTVIDYLRKKQNLKLYENSNIETDKDNPEDFAQINEQLRLVNRAIQALNDDQKEVIILKFMTGLSNKEIAKHIKKSEDSIRQTQHRALKILKVKLRKLYE